MSNGADIERQPLVNPAPEHAYGASDLTSDTIEALDNELDEARKQQVENEMSNPWPATFERSAMLLATNQATPALVTFASESMHVLPPTKIVRNTSLTNLNRGWATPDPVAASSRAAREALTGNDDDGDGDDKFTRMGIKRNNTLDWRAGRPRPASEIARAEKRAKKLEELQLLARAQSFDFRVKGAKAAEETGEVADAGDKANFTQCVFNMSNMLMGIGILSLPYVFKLAGLVGGFISLSSFCIITWWTSIVLGRMLNGDPRPRYLFDDSADGLKLVRMRKTITSFPAIAREAFGQPGAIWLSSAMYLELFSCMAAFLLSSGDHLHLLIPSVSKYTHMALLAAFLTIPTTLLNTPKLLSYLSTVGTFTTTAVVLSVFAAACVYGDISEESAARNERFGASPVSSPYHVMFIGHGLPVASGLVAFCFSGHAIVPTVYTSMAQPHRFESMMGISFLLVLACCFIVGLSGYYMFGNAVLDQITISLERAPIDADYATDFLSWLIIITLFSKFCLYQFPLALGIEELVAPYIPNNKAMEWTYAGIKIGLIVSSLLVGMYAPGFAFLTALVGLICSMSVSVIFPPAAHLKLFGVKNLPAWEVAVDVFIVVGGTFFAVGGTIATWNEFRG